MRICIKRVYEAASPDDGERILVDRLWPRGLSKEKAAIDIWEKDVAPSAALRKWFGHDPDKFDDFRNKYRKELEDNQVTPQKTYKGMSVTSLDLALSSKHQET